MAQGDPFVWCMHNCDEGHDKMYAVAVLHEPGGKFGIRAWWGRATAGSAQASKQYHTGLANPDFAQRLAIAMAVAKAKRGYQELTSPSYHGGLTTDGICAMIEMMYVVREGVPSPFSPQASQSQGSVSVVHKAPLETVSGQAKRVVDV